MNSTGQPSSFEALFLPLIFSFGILYFFMIRPQGKKMRQQENFVANLKRGDAVVTQSGILGTIDGLNDNFVTLEIADGVKIKMLKRQIQGSQAALTASVTTAAQNKK